MIFEVIAKYIAMLWLYLLRHLALCSQLLNNTIVDHNWRAVYETGLALVLA